MNTTHPRLLIRIVTVTALIWLLLLRPAYAALSDEDSDHLRDALLLSGLALTAFHQDKKGVTQYATSTATSAAITLFLKSVVDSERPNQLDNNSFPSGHTTLAFASAGFIHRRYGLSFGVPAYVTATAVAASRVENDHHRIVDVVAGALISLAVNNKFVTQNVQTNLKLTGTQGLLTIKLRF